MSDELLEQMKRLAAEKPPWGETSDYFADYPAPEMPASRLNEIWAAVNDLYWAGYEEGRGYPADVKAARKALFDLLGIPDESGHLRDDEREPAVNPHERPDYPSLE